jgi:hypothetical protein
MPLIQPATTHDASQNSARSGSLPARWARRIAPAKIAAIAAYSSAASSRRRPVPRTRPVEDTWRTYVIIPTNGQLQKTRWLHQRGRRGE